MEEVHHDEECNEQWVVLYAKHREPILPRKDEVAYYLKQNAVVDDPAKHDFLHVTEDNVAHLVPDNCHQVLIDANVLEDFVKDDQFASLAATCYACDDTVWMATVSLEYERVEGTVAYLFSFTLKLLDSVEEILFLNFQPSHFALSELVQVCVKRDVCDHHESSDNSNQYHKGVDRQCLTDVMEDKHGYECEEERPQSEDQRVEDCVLLNEDPHCHSAEAVSFLHDEYIDREQAHKEQSVQNDKLEFKQECKDEIEPEPGETSTTFDSIRQQQVYVELHEVLVSESAPEHHPENGSNWFVGDCDNGVLVVVVLPVLKWLKGFLLVCLIFLTRHDLVLVNFGFDLILVVWCISFVIAFFRLVIVIDWSDLILLLFLVLKLFPVASWLITLWAICSFRFTLIFMFFLDLLMQIKCS